MNKRQEKKVIGLIKDGVPTKTILIMIIQLTETPEEAADIIYRRFNLREVTFG